MIFDTMCCNIAFNKSLFLTVILALILNKILHSKLVIISVKYQLHVFFFCFFFISIMSRECIFIKRRYVWWYPGVFLFVNYLIYTSEAFSFSKLFSNYFLMDFAFKNNNPYQAFLKSVNFCILLKRTWPKSRTSFLHVNFIKHY